MIQKVKAGQVKTAKAKKGISKNVYRTTTMIKKKKYLKD